MPTSSRSARLTEILRVFTSPIAAQTYFRPYHHAKSQRMGLHQGATNSIGLGHVAIFSSRMCQYAGASGYFGCQMPPPAGLEVAHYLFPPYSAYYYQIIRNSSRLNKKWQPSWSLTTTECGSSVLGPSRLVRAVLLLVLKGRSIPRPSRPTPAD